VTGGVRLCCKPAEDAKKAKQDEASAVIPDAVLNRKHVKKEKTFQYEVKWQFKPIEANSWVEKDTLIKMGYIKMVQREDEKQAAMAGLMTKQLTQPSIEQHLAAFGVLIISHNKEFCDGVATEKWIMNKGYLRIEGESVDTSDKTGNAQVGPDEVFDGAGNKIDVNRAKTLSDKDRKKEIKDLEKKLKDGKKKKTLSEEEMWEIDDKLLELKEGLAK